MDKLLKKAAIRFMGGRCQICGYSKSFRALHFHHINPKTKSFDISSSHSWNEIELELNKCILVCSNCHAEIHDGLIGEQQINEKK